MAVFSLSTRSTGRSPDVWGTTRAVPSADWARVYAVPAAPPAAGARIRGSGGTGGSQRTGWRLAYKATLAKHHNLNRPELGP